MLVNIFFRNKLAPSMLLRGLALLYYCMFSALFVVTKVAASASPRIVAITSGTSPVYEQVIEQINRTLTDTCTDKGMACLTVDQVVRATDETKDIVSIVGENSSNLIITLGTRAAKSVADASVNIPTLYTLLPESIFNKLPNCCPLKTSAIFLNQPLDRQIDLIRTALPKHRRLGVIYGPSSRYAEPQIKALAKRAGLELESVMVESRADVGAALRRLLKRIDVLLALPDPEVYSKQTVFNVLLSSYHNGVPVVGFSKGYVKAGALLALYSTPEQIGRHIAKVVQQYFSSGQQLPPPQYPEDFSVLINESVAHSFKIRLPAETLLRDSVLDRQE